MPIRARIALFGAGVVTATLVLFGALLLLLSTVSSARLQDSTLTKRGDAAVSMLESAVPPDLQPRPALAPIDLRTSFDTFVEVLNASGTPITSGATLDGAPPVFDTGTLAKTNTNGSARATVRLAPGLQVRVYIRRWSRPELGLVDNYVIAGQSTRQLGNNLRGLIAFVVIAAVVSLIAALAATWWVSGRSLRPLREMARTADEIGGTADLSRRLPEIKPQDEIGRLTRSFNAMLVRLHEASGKLEEAYQRVAASLDVQKQFVADASHELRTPLTTIRSNAGFLLSGREIAPDDREAALQDIAAEAKRMSRLVQDLLTLARADAGQHLDRVALDLSALAGTAVRQAARAHTDRSFAVEAPVPIQVLGDPDALTQLLWILIDNGVRHTQRGDRVTVRVQQQAATVRLSVTDDGDGIPSGELERIFERFYQADRARGSGAGLGLSIARWIVEEHGGRISAVDNPSGGATFNVELPAALEASGAPQL